MNKHIGLSVVIAGMLCGMPSVNAQAAVGVSRPGSRVTLVINSEPSFVYIRTQGFSISVGSPYDIVYYGNRYYLNYRGRWYRSYSYRGPWILIGNSGLPLRIRRHRLADLRRYRDIEYRKPDSRNNRYQRDDDNRRRMLEQKYSSPEGRKVREQPMRAPEGRKVQEQPMRAPEGRKAEEQPMRAPEGRKAEEQPMRAPEGRKFQEQPKRAPEGRKFQEQPMRAPEGRKFQEQPTKSDNKEGKKGQNDKRKD
ncbi:MAG: hypothetical protein HGB23_10865 [Chlorobiaceae bacterium]|nr:hypothetical protein [Chlorobiaceae bacterium]